LEAELEKLRPRPRRAAAADANEDEMLPPLDQTEPPSPYMIITATAGGLAKCTFRHAYTRQRRAGMGVFDLEAPDDDPPAILAHVHQDQTVLLITNQGRAFRTLVSSLAEGPVRARGESVTGRLLLAEGERLAGIVPIQAEGYLAMASQRGMVRLLRHHVFGEYMKPGTVLLDAKTFGPFAAACWTPGDADLFIGTHQGRAIRFSEKLVPPQGAPGIRLADDDQAVAIAPAYPDSRILLLSADGKGSLRSMENFSANKAPGAGGKNVMATDELVAAFNVDAAEDVFIISKLGKIIRFPAAEVPEKEGVVQGVHCMSFRADQAVAAAVSLRPHIL
jgi:DNA gyrase subunit A